MKKLDRESLLAALSDEGYPLMETERKTDPYRVLAGVISSDEPRIIEGFPILLANFFADEKEQFDLLKFAGKLNKRKKGLFEDLLVLSTALFYYYSYKHGMEKMKKFESVHREKVQDVKDKLTNNVNLKVGGRAISSERIKNTFMNYIVNKNLHSLSSFKERADLKDEFTIEFNLSKLFSPKQKELIMKKLTGQNLTKTENEYYSRVVKKKILAIANPEVHRIAQKLLQ